MTPASFVRDLTAFWVQIAFVVLVVAGLLKVVSMPARARYVCLRLALAGVSGGTVDVALRGCRHTGAAS